MTFDEKFEQDLERLVKVIREGEDEELHDALTTFLRSLKEMVAAVAQRVVQVELEKTKQERRERFRRSSPP